MKQFSESIPVSIEEAARIDGAGIFRTFWTIVLPMPRPPHPLHPEFPGVMERVRRLRRVAAEPRPEHPHDRNTLTTGIASLFSGHLGSGHQFPLKLAAAILMTIPVATIFFHFQRKILNTTEGGEKG